MLVGYLCRLSYNESDLSMIMNKNLNKVLI